MPDDFDDLFFSRIRLVVVAELLQAEWIAFTDLQSLTGATRGNLGSHLAKLVESGVIHEEKRFVRQRPLTRYRLTSAGRAAFLRHVKQVEGLFEAARREYTEADRSPAGDSNAIRSPRSSPTAKP